eukprot:scaffold7228_cov523-Prasinococcus_capsulatus_cf.AAC.17
MACQNKIDLWHCIREQHVVGQTHVRACNDDIHTARLQGPCECTPALHKVLDSRKRTPGHCLTRRFSHLHRGPVAQVSLYNGPGLPRKRAYPIALYETHQGKPYTAHINDMRCFCSLYVLARSLVHNVRHEPAATASTALRAFSSSSRACSSLVQRFWPVSRKFTQFIKPYHGNWHASNNSDAQLTPKSKSWFPTQAQQTPSSFKIGGMCLP